MIASFTDMFDLRFKLFILSALIYVTNWFATDVLDLAGKAGTLPMQVLMMACIVILGGVIVWQNKSREQLNKERQEENQKWQQELSQRLAVQQAAIDAERVTRIGKLMEQQADSIVASKDLTQALTGIGRALESNNRVVERLVEHLNK